MVGGWEGVEGGGGSERPGRWGQLQLYGECPVDVQSSIPESDPVPRSLLVRVLQTQSLTASAIAKKEMLWLCPVEDGVMWKLNSARKWNVLFRVRVFSIGQ
jgi:hypothetical protein